jgi:hypothetical protein
MVPPLLLRIDSHIVIDSVFREVVEQDNRSEMQIKGGRKGSGNIREEEFSISLATRTPPPPHRRSPLRWAPATTISLGLATSPSLLPLRQLSKEAEEPSPGMPLMRGKASSP